MDGESFFGNFYKIFFDSRTPCAGLSKYEQQTCFLIMLGLSPKQIAGHLSTTAGCIAQYQNKAGIKLYEAGYHSVAIGMTTEGMPKHNRESLSKVVFDNLHEVQSHLLSLYPWPEDAYIR